MLGGGSQRGHDQMTLKIEGMLGCDLQVSVVRISSRFFTIKTAYRFALRLDEHMQRRWLQT